MFSSKSIAVPFISLILMAACSDGSRSDAKQPVSKSQASSATDHAVVVSSKIDTEGTLLGNMILLSLESNGIKVQDKLGLGGLPIVRQAIIAGEVDIVPEYTGNGAFMFPSEKDLKNDARWKDLQSGWEMVKKLDFDANKLVWLSPANANNTYALAVREDVATKNHLASMSDFGKWVASGGDVKMMVSQEFVNFGGALPEFEKAYGFKAKPDQMVVVSGGDTANTIKAAAQQTNGVNTAMVYGTDGAIAPSKLTVMTDDKHTQVVYAPAPVVREATLQANPKIKDILEPVFASLDAATLQGLNARIQVDGEQAKEVAKSYLLDKKLIK